MSLDKHEQLPPDAPPNIFEKTDGKFHPNQPPEEPKPNFGTGTENDPHTNLMCRKNK
jgi:hypothetical protein